MLPVPAGAELLPEGKAAVADAAAQERPENQLLGRIPSFDRIGRMLSVWRSRQARGKLLPMSLRPRG